jgi:hypothetical protein
MNMTAPVAQPPVDDALLAQGLSPGLRAEVEKLPADELRPAQRLLLAGTLRAHRQFFGNAAGVVARLLAMAVVFLLGALATGGATWLLLVLLGRFGTYLVAIAVLAFLVVITRVINEGKVRWKKVGDQLDHLELGRLSSLLDDGGFYGPLAFVGAVFGLQYVHLREFPEALGLPADLGHWNSLLAFADALLDATLFNLPSLYDLHLGPPRGGVGWWPATVNLVFNVLYAGFVLHLIVRTSRRRRVRALYARFPKDGSWQALVDWMEALSREQPELGRLLHDELVFNMLVEEYTRGEFALVRAVARQFEGIAVENDVRAMFVDPRDGAPLFAPTTKSAR